MSLFTKILAAGAVAACAVPASALVTTYSDRATFTADTGVTTIETFLDSSYFPISSGILNSSTTDAGLPAGSILPGVTYSTPVGTDFFFNIDAGGGFDGGFLDSLVTDAPRALTIAFDASQGAFGFDTNFLMGSFSIAIFGAGGEIYSNVFASPLDSQLTFFGFANSEATIRQVVIQGNREQGFNFALDNFTFTRSGAVPEPTSWAMLICGFGLVGAAARRRLALAR